MHQRENIGPGSVSGSSQSWTPVDSSRTKGGNPGVKTIYLDKNWLGGKTIIFIWSLHCQETLMVKL